MPELEVHAASPDERLAAYRNVHDVWGGGLTLEAHVERRLGSVQHNRAAWYVGCLDGRVVSSLAAYPLQFHVRGSIVPGFSIGSVHTLAEQRGRGFAVELIRRVEAERRERGQRVALLYSDIPCRYYARLGYIECPAWEIAHAVDTNTGSVSQQESNPSGDDSHGGSPYGGKAEDDGWRLAAVQPLPVLDELMRCYDAYHGRLPLAVARSREYWLYTLEKQPRDEFFLLQRGGATHGYVRLSRRSDAQRIADFALASLGKSAAQDERLAETLLRCVLGRIARTATSRLEGWIPDWPPSRAAFELRPRNREITMVKSLDEALVLDAPAIAATHCFCEIDHV